MKSTKKRSMFKLHKRSETAAVLIILILFLLYSIAMFVMTGGLCIFRGIFGLPCPACGGTRAIILLARGDVNGCMELNPSAPLLFLCLLNEIRISYFNNGNKKLAGILLAGSIVISIIIYIIRMNLHFPYREPYVFNDHSLVFRYLRTLQN